jgi:hypothetical protein
LGGRAGVPHTEAQVHNSTTDSTAHAKLQPLRLLCKSPSRRSCDEAVQKLPLHMCYCDALDARLPACPSARRHNRLLLLGLTRMRTRGAAHHWAMLRGLRVLHRPLALSCVLLGIGKPAVH